jgi:hypothetical protein
MKKTAYQQNLHLMEVICISMKIPLAPRDT